MFYCKTFLRFRLCFFTIMLFCSVVLLCCFSLLISPIVFSIVFPYNEVYGGTEVRKVQRPVV